LSAKRETRGFETRDSLMLIPGYVGYA